MSTPDPTDPNQYTEPVEPGPDEVVDAAERTTPVGPDDIEEDPLPAEAGSTELTFDDEGHRMFMTASLPSTLAPAVTDLLAALTAALPAGVRIDHLSLTHEDDEQGEDEDPVVSLQADDRVHLRTSSGSTLGRVVKVQEPQDRPVELTVEDEPLYGLWVRYPDGPSGWATLTDGRVILGPLSEIVQVNVPRASPRVFPTPAHPKELRAAGGFSAAFRRMLTGEKPRVADLAFPYNTNEGETWTRAS